MLQCIELYYFNWSLKGDPCEIRFQNNFTDWVLRLSFSAVSAPLSPNAAYAAAGDDFTDFTESFLSSHYSPGPGLLLLIAIQRPHTQSAKALNLGYQNLYLPFPP